MRKCVCFIFILASIQLAAQKVKLSSPDGNLQFTFQQQDNKFLYNISFLSKPVVNTSEIRLDFSDGSFSGSSAKIKKTAYREATETYDLVVGKTKHVADRFKEAVITLETNSPKRTLNLVVRAFNDGISFRYEFPQQSGWDSYTLTNEQTTFNLAGDPTVHALFLPGYTTSFEGLYTSMPLSKIKADTLMTTPVLFQSHDQIYLAITEAALLDYAGMYLSKKNGLLTSTLSPLPGQEKIKVKATLPHHTPWRVLMISNRVGTLIESNILTSLNEPNKIKDVSWIRPGKTTWPWWNGNVTPDSSFAPGNNFETQKYYIDFCARNGIEYHSVVEYGLKEWYVNDGAGFVPGPHVDVTKTVPGLDMKQVCDYAKSKGVGIRVWIHWKALYPAPRLDSAFAALERWGVSGMMVDFMDRDDQEMVNMQTEMLEKAAYHHLHLQFHGAYKPTGLSRTYPNEFTREGTLNYESNKWADGLTADHDIMLPFTRMLAGPTDYHLGGFRAVPPTQYKIQYTRPLMLGTRCHQLAMHVVLESYLGMVADYPDAYHGQPGFEFIQKVPTVWDETKVLQAGVAEYITIARRKNMDWYIGSITNHERRELRFLLSFLGEGEFTAEIYTDAPDVKENPNHLTKQIRKITRKDTIILSLAEGGGAVVHITPAGR